TYTVNFSATDLGTLSVTGWKVNWGDNWIDTLPATASTASHVYADNAFRNVTVTATTTGPQSPSASQFVTVNNVAPTLLSVTPAIGLIGIPVTLDPASFSDPGFTDAKAGTQETFSATINWGDGSPTANGTVNMNQGSAGTPSTFTVTGTHPYTTPG